MLGKNDWKYAVPLIVLVTITVLSGSAGIISKIILDWRHDARVAADRANRLRWRLLLQEPKMIKSFKRLRFIAAQLNFKECTFLVINQDKLFQSLRFVTVLNWKY